VSTGLASAPQLSDWFVAALALRVQLPGPRSGTSTDSKPGSSVPLSAPLIALMLDVGATGFAVEVVTFEKLLSTDDVPFVIFAVTITGVDVFVAFVGGRVDVVTLGTCVVAGDVEEGGRDETSGALGVEAVSVKTRTSNRSGLDHIKRWALFSEKGERIVFVG
jgi:hypothetical protein